MRPVGGGAIEDQNMDAGVRRHGFRRGRGRDSPLERLYNLTCLSLRMIYLFMLSAHHDWIEPVLRRYDAEHAEAAQAREVADRIHRLRGDLR